MTQDQLNNHIKKLTDSTLNRQEYLELMDFISGDNLSFDASLDTAMAQIDIEQANHLVENRQTPADTYAKIIAHPRFTKQKKLIPVWMKIAAMWLCLMSSLFTGYYLLRFSSAKLMREDFTYKTITTPRGDRKKITFKDGSIVWLNSESSLSYSNAYNTEDRKVELSGEGYFEVAAQKDKPFIVRKGNMSVTVLGTGFNINSFSPDKLSVTVKHGKVKVQDLNKDISILTKNQQLNYNQVSKTAEILQTDARDIMTWSQNILTFDDVSFGEAAKVLARWYNVSFEFDNEHLKNCRSTITFRAGESLDQALKVLAELEGFTYIIEGKTVHIKGRGC